MRNFLHLDEWDKNMKAMDSEDLLKTIFLQKDIIELTWQGDLMPRKEFKKKYRHEVILHEKLVNEFLGRVSGGTL